MDDERVRQDEQGVMEEPPAPGRSKMENLRRIERQLEEQRERIDAAAETEERDDAPPMPSERPEDDDRT